MCYYHGCEPLCLFRNLAVSIRIYLLYLYKKHQEASMKHLVVISPLVLPYINVVPLGYVEPSSFFFPTSSDSTPAFPENFLTGPLKSNDTPLSRSKKTTSFYLNDGIHVLSTFGPQVQSSGSSLINSNEESDAPQGNKNGKRKGREQVLIINKKRMHNK
jgi:hypothetical protein